MAMNSDSRGRVGYSVQWALYPLLIHYLWALESLFGATATALNADRPHVKPTRKRRATTAIYYDARRSPKTWLR